MEALARALALEQDASLKLLLSSLLCQAGDRRGLQGLVEVTRSDVPFLRMEADDRLRALAAETAPVYEPLDGPDSGSWQAWLDAQDGLPAGMEALELP